jgi:hypothetical protein
MGDVVTAIGVGVLSGFGIWFILEMLSRRDIRRLHKRGL